MSRAVLLFTGLKQQKPRWRINMFQFLPQVSTQSNFASIANHISVGDIVVCDIEAIVF